jgi:hypothetical protein
MKALGSIFMCLSLLLSGSGWALAANLGSNLVTLNQNSVESSTETDSDGVAMSTISFNRADLSKPQILRVYGMLDNSLVPLERVEVKINGKIIKTIAGGSLEMNLAPMMTAGRYEINVSGKSAKLDTAISLYFIGTHVKVDRKSSGTGKIEQKLIINVR